MRKTILTTFLIFFMAIWVNAQEYTTGIGFRGGFSQGLTVKHFISDNTALEGILSTRWGGFNITGLYEIHANAFDTPGLSWYYGIGGHIGYVSGEKNDRWSDKEGNYPVLGIDGILGLEYSFDEIPINLSIDWKPAINLAQNPFWGDSGALSVRYIF